MKLMRMARRLAYKIGLTGENYGTWAAHLKAASGRTGALPGIMIVGAKKCGTTSLHDLLAHHPSVKAPLIKESHFFENARRFGWGEKWYRAWMPILAVGEVTLDSTPMMYHRAALRRVAQINPEAKYIFVLRDPVKRAYSHYLHNVARFREPLPFLEACVQEDVRIACQDVELETENTNSLAYRNYSYVLQGRYADHIRAWQGVFGADRVKVVFFDELIARPAPVLADLLEFLELPAAELGAPPHSNARLVDGEIPPEAEDWLRQTYRASDDDLRALLNRDLPWR